MTIATVEASITLQGNGATTNFGFPFIVPYEDDGITPTLEIYITTGGVPLGPIATSLYTVIGVGNPTGGSVVYPLSGSPLTAGQYITIIRTVPYIQPDAFNNQSFRPLSVEMGLDNVELQLQQLLDEFNRTIVMPIGTPLTPLAWLEEQLQLQSGGLTTAYFSTTALALSSSFTGIPVGTLLTTGGRDTVSDGGGAAFYLISSGADNGGTLRGPTADGKYLQAVLQTEGTLELFGAKGGGVDDSVAITKLNAWANTGVGCAYGTNGKTYTTTVGLAFDHQYANFDGRGCRFECSGIAAGTPWLWQYSSVSTDLVKWTHNPIHGVRHVSFFNDDSTIVSGVIAHQVGHVTYQNNNDFQMQGLSFYGADTGLKIISNAWRLKWDRCFYLTGGGTYAVDYGATSTITNSGEVLLFDHCCFVGQTPLAFVASIGGEIRSLGTSFLGGASIQSDNGVQFTDIGGNIESLNVTNYRQLWVKNAVSSATLVGTSLIQNTGGLGTDAWTISPFKNDGGLINLIGVFFAQGSWAAYYNEAANAGVNTLITGTGRVVLVGLPTYNGLPGLRNVTPAASASLVYNGGAETGNLNGWTVTPFGTAGSTGVVDTTSKIYGTYGFHLTGVSGGGVIVTQSFPVFAGQHVQGTCWAKAISGSGFFQMQLYADTAMTIGVGAAASTNFTSSTASFGQADLIVPAGAKVAQIILSVSGVSELYFDAISVNAY